MPDSIADGRTRVGFTAAIASISAPTAAELNAGILLHAILTPDGLIGFEATTAPIPTEGLSFTYDTTDVGRDSFSGPMLRFRKQTTGDTIFTTLGAKGVTGFIVIRRDIDVATAWLATQPVEVYPIKTARRRNLAPEKNSVRKYEVPVMIWQEPNLDAVIA